MVGSKKYMAPEILKKRPYDTKVDVWSATVTIFVLLTGQLPFRGKTTESLLTSIKSKEMELDLKDNRYLSKNAKDFLLKGLECDPLKRASCCDMLVHPWLQNARNPVPSHSQVFTSSSNNDVELSYFMARAGHELPKQQLKVIVKRLYHQNGHEAVNLSGT